MFDRLQKIDSRIPLALCLVLLAAGFLFYSSEIKQLFALIRNENLHPAYLVAAFLILPVLFFPFSALLIVIGLRFDMWAGILILFAAMPVHLAVSYYLARQVFHDRLKKYARRRFQLDFQVPQRRQTQFSFLFMVIPGLPYTVKNYLLPLSGIPFGKYLLISWLVQGTMGIPFVVLGDAASKWNVALLLIFLVLFAVVYFISNYIRKTRGRSIR